MNPKVLVFDVETAPILSWVWGLFDQNVGLNQIDSDWYILSWAAKWLGEPASKVMYMDQRYSKNIEDDSRILRGLWKLLDEADVVITQNGNSFDIKKLNARFIMHGMKPPSSYKCIDTLLIAKAKFKFTSNKLEYMTDKLCKKYKKLKHTKFQGFDLWSQCLKGNREAWKTMEEYNKYDVLSLEELYNILAPWYGGFNFDIYSDSKVDRCNCGSTELKKNGIFYTSIARYQRYKCKTCGAEFRGHKNLLTKTDHKPLKRI